MKGTGLGAECQQLGAAEIRTGKHPKLGGGGELNWQVHNCLKFSMWKPIVILLCAATTPPPPPFSMYPAFLNSPMLALVELNMPSFQLEELSGGYVGHCSSLTGLVLGWFACGVILPLGLVTTGDELWH